MSCLSQEYINDINNLAIAVFNGQHNKLEKWLDEPSFIEQAKLLLEQPGIPFYAGFYAIQVIQRHLVGFFDMWSFDEQIDFLWWYIELVFKQNALFSSNDSLSHIYSKILGIILARGWHSDKRFHAVLDTFMERIRPLTINHLVITIFNEISDSMCRNRILDFQNNYLSFFFKYCFTALYNVMDEKTTESALEAIKIMLEFNQKNKDKIDNDIFNLTIELNQQCTCLIINQNTMNVLINVSQKYFNDKCLEIMTLVLALNHNYISKNDYFEFLKLLMNFAYYNFNNCVSFYSFTRFLFCLKKSFDNFYANSQDYNEEFTKGAFDFTIKHFKINYLLDSPSGIHNLLMFWNTYSECADPNVCYYQMKVIQEFVSCCMDSLVEEIDEAVEIFGLLSTSILPMFTTIRDISKDIIPEVINVCIFPFFDKISYQNYSAQVAFLCNLLFSLTVSLNLKLKMSYEEDTNKILTAISNIYIRILTIYKKQISTEYIINSFISFLIHFNKCYCISTMSTMSRKIYQNLKRSLGISSISDLLDLLFNLLWEMLENLTQPKLIYDASLALSKLFDRTSYFFYFVIKLPIVQQIVQKRVENIFPFLQTIEHSRSRVIFHRSICSILLNKEAKDLCDQYLHTYDDLFNKINPLSLWGFLRDFTGFFEAVKTQSEYNIFFDYLFEDKLQKLLNIVPCIIQNPIIINSLLKFWLVMLQNDNRKIVFEHHSTKGIILFHYTVDLLTTLLDKLVDQIQSDNKQNVKFINYCLNIIYYSLNSDYVPFNAIKVFKDSSINKIFTSFSKCSTIVPVNELSSYPKIEKVLQKLNLCICQKHINIAITTNCIHICLIIIIYGLKSFDGSAKEISIESLLCILSNKDIVREFKQELMIRIIFNLFDLVINTFNTQNNNNYKLHICIRETIKSIPELLSIIHQRMIQHIKEESSLSFEESFNNLKNLLLENNNSDQFHPLFEKYIFELKTNLKTFKNVF